MASPASAPPSSATPVTIVTQTRVRPEGADAFARWQQRVNDVIAGFAGYRDHEVIPPDPPTQVDWVITQRFTSVETARAWLESAERQQLLDEVQPFLVGQDDVHLVRDGEQRGPAPVAAIISTRVKPGQEDAFRQWQRRASAVQATFEGFQGYKLEPPIPGVQDDWTIVLRFDSDAHLDAWLTSPQRQQLLQDTAIFDAETHLRRVRSGFDAWFASGSGASSAPPVWKQSMLVILSLYPIVFLFGFWVMNPLLIGRASFPFWLALFVANVSGTLILNVVAPWVGQRFSWWLNPAGPDPRRINAIGAAVLVVMYGLWLLAFSRFP